MARPAASGKARKVAKMPVPAQEHYARARLLMLHGGDAQKVPGLS